METDVTQIIPLNKLIPSKLNVRRHSDPDADAQLKADIAQRGLLQNLVVGAVTKPKGCFEVLAGGRRLAQLQALASEGVLAKDHGVDCLSIDGDDAARAEASLAENFQRLRMNPADECDAFRRMIELGSDIEGIARRFGLTTRFVEGRLRLANLAPTVFEALREGQITLDIAKAYGTTSDQDRQAQVFLQLSGGYNANDLGSIRRMMTKTVVTGSDRRARLVGREAYIAAGGRVDRDLFASKADDEQWLDVAILERLASERMEVAAAEAASTTGLGWIKPTLNDYVEHDSTRDLHPVKLETQRISDEDQVRIDQLDCEYEAIAGDLEDEEFDPESYAAAEAKAHEIQAAMSEIANKTVVVPDELKPLVGAFLVLGDDGKPVLHHQRYAEAPIEGVTERPMIATRYTPDRPATRANKEAGLSQQLVNELAMQRRDVLAAHVAHDTGFALDLAIFLMADEQQTYLDREKPGSTLIARAATGPESNFHTPKATATCSMATTKEGLETSWAESADRRERFDQFRALSDEDRAAWLAYCVARTLEASLNLSGERRVAFHDHLGTKLQIDTARWWRPTVENYFGRVSRATNLAALTEVGGQSLAQRYAGSKKAELAQACERVFAGDFIDDIEVKQRAIAWVPSAMRFAANSEPAATNADETDEFDNENAPIADNDAGGNGAGQVDQIAA